MTHSVSCGWPALKGQQRSGRQRSVPPVRGSSCQLSGHHARLLKSLRESAGHHGAAAARLTRDRRCGSLASRRTCDTPGLRPQQSVAATPAIRALLHHPGRALPHGTGNPWRPPAVRAASALGAAPPPHSSALDRAPWPCPRPMRNLVAPSPCLHPHNLAPPWPAPPRSRAASYN